MPSFKPLSLKRYTSLASAIDLLTNKRMTFLTPSNWEDKNDVLYIEKYRELKKLTNVLAVCFSKAGETAHHWQVFSKTNEGVCVEFNKEALIQEIYKHIGSIHGSVKYKLVKNMKSDIKEKRGIALEQLPFISACPSEMKKNIEFYIVRAVIQKMCTI